MLQQWKMQRAFDTLPLSKGLLWKPNELQFRPMHTMHEYAPECNNAQRGRDIHIRLLHPIRNNWQ
jgi:hypothetical protein